MAVRLEGVTKLRVPIHTLSGIACFGQVSCTPFLMALCADRGVGLSFLTEHGRFLARVQGPVSGNVLLRREQYRISDDLSRQYFHCAGNRIRKNRQWSYCAIACFDANGRNLANPSNSTRCGVTHTRRILEDVERAETTDTIRGHEGDAARTYFQVFDHLILASKEDFYFRVRSRRPPLDNMNALLLVFVHASDSRCRRSIRNCWPRSRCWILAQREAWTVVFSS